MLQFPGGRNVIMPFCVKLDVPSVTLGTAAQALPLKYSNSQLTPLPIV